MPVEMRTIMSTKYTFLIICLYSLLPAASFGQGVLYETVISNIQTGKLAETEAALRMASNTQKSTPEWAYLNGRLMMAKEDFDGATPHFRKALELRPENAEYQYWMAASICLATERANIMRQTFMAGRCKTELENTIALEPDHVQARMSLIEFHIKAPGIVGGSYDEASSLSNELMRIQPFFGYVSQYQIAISKKDTLEGIRALESGAKALPDSIWFMFNLGNLYEARKSYELSYRNFSDAYKKKPEAWAVGFQLGRLAATTGLFLDEALPVMENLIQNRPKDMQDPVYSMAHTRLGQIHLHMGNRTLAKEHFNTALKIRFDNPIASDELKKLN